MNPAEEFLRALSEIDAQIVNALAQLQRALKGPADEKIGNVEEIATLLPDLKRQAEGHRSSNGAADPNAAILIGLRLDAIEGMITILIAIMAEAASKA